MPPKKAASSLTYISGEEGLEKITVPEGFEVNRLCRREDAVPGGRQSRADAGRCQGPDLGCEPGTTYPKWEPLKEMNDSPHHPRGHRRGWEGGQVQGSSRRSTTRSASSSGAAVCSSPPRPELLFLKDTDGDDVADVRYVIDWAGFRLGRHPPHRQQPHLRPRRRDLLAERGLPPVHNHEHAVGAKRSTLGSSAMFRFDPRSSSSPSRSSRATRPNPHGTSPSTTGDTCYANRRHRRQVAYQVRPEGTGLQDATLS